MTRPATKHRESLPVPNLPPEAFREFLSLSAMTDEEFCRWASVTPAELKRWKSKGVGGLASVAIDLLQQVGIERPPVVPVDTKTYSDGCTAALSPHLAALTSRAAAAGWDRIELATTLLFWSISFALRLAGPMSVRKIFASAEATIVRDFPDKPPH